MNPGRRVDHASLWLARNVLAAYLILAVGVVASFLAMGLGFRSVTERIDAKAVESCEAGNERSRIQRDDYLASRAQTEKIDLVTLLGITPAQAEEVRRLSVEATERRIAALPFQDCRTGKRLPPAP